MVQFSGEHPGSVNVVLHSVFELVLFGWIQPVPQRGSDSNPIEAHVQADGIDMVDEGSPAGCLCRREAGNSAVNAALFKSFPDLIKCHHHGRGT